MPRISTWLLLPLLLAGSASAAAGDEYPFTHLRATQAEARRLLERAAAESPTVRRMIGDIEASDVVAYVALTPFLSLPSARTTFISADGPQRYVSVALNEENPADDLIAYLGHELQHVVEVAHAPEVRDAASFERLYRRIGRPSGEDVFETDAAVEAGRRVRMELHAASESAHAN